MDRAAAVVPFIFPIYILIHASVTAFSAVVPFRGDPIDGAFQIFDPLRRIAAGQIPGVDFQFYHGILVPFVHYPLFALLGKTIFASELSRHFVSLGAFVASLYFLCLAYTRKLGAAATLSTLAVLLLLVSGAYGLIYPGVSLPGLRSTPPLILFAILLCDLEAVRAAASARVGCRPGGGNEHRAWLGGHPGICGCGGDFCRAQWRVRPMLASGSGIHHFARNWTRRVPWLAVACSRDLVHSEIQLRRCSQGSILVIWFASGQGAGFSRRPFRRSQGLGAAGSDSHSIPRFVNCSRAEACEIDV